MMPSILRFLRLTIYVLLFANSVGMVVVYVDSERARELRRERMHEEGKLQSLKREVEGLRMEWAHLNRPEHIAHLVQQFGEKLQLVPMKSQQIRNLPKE